MGEPRDYHRPLVSGIHVQSGIDIRNPHWVDV